MLNFRKGAVEAMLDIETLALTPDAVVLSVGVVIWETDETDSGHLVNTIADRIYIGAPKQVQLDKGRSVDYDTIAWWARQEDDVRDLAFRPDDPYYTITTEMSLRNITRVCNQHNVDRFWAKPAAFDFPVLESLFRDFNVALPWNHRQRYDVGTLADAAEYTSFSHTPKLAELQEDKAHDPVYDCLWQIDYLTAARAALRGDYHNYSWSEE